MEGQMSFRSRMKTWWKAVSKPTHLRRQMQEELEFHIENYAEDLMRNGVPRTEAMRRARAELGSIPAGAEQCRAAWGTQLVDELRANLGFAARMLAKSPAFTSIAIGSLALGIGANTVIFTAAQHMLLDKLAVPHPNDLRMLWWTQPNNNGIVEQMWGYFDDGPQDSQVSTSFSYPVFEQLRRQNRSMQDVFAFKPMDGQTVNVGGRAEADDVEMVSGNYYAALGVKPQVGRLIQQSDDSRVGSGPVVVISDAFWARHFGRSSDAIGKTILLNSTPLTVVGVNPKDFTGAYSAQGNASVFVPFSMQPIVAPSDFGAEDGPSLLTNTKLWWVLVMGRVKPGVQDDKAAAELNVTLDAAVRSTMTATGKVMPRLLLREGSRGQNPSAGELTKPIYVLLALAGLVLLLACANLANLLLARGAARQREMSVRLAMGATRRRILRQVMTENLMLSLAGGAAGLLLAYAVRNGLPRLMADSWSPPAFAARFDWRIFCFALLVSITTGLIFGLGPAWAATRVEAGSGLKDSAQTATRRRRGLAGKSIVVVQVALSMVLVVGAGLFVRTLMSLAHARLGFNPDRITLFGVAPPQTKYPKAATLPLYEAIEQRLAAIPGVEHVALTRVPLVSGSVSTHTFVPEGTARKKPGENPSVQMDDVGRDFFATYQIPIIAGRAFDATDTPTSRKVAVINQSLEKKYFPNVDPVGRTFEDGSRTPIQITIVGVCADAKYVRLREDPGPTFYMPYWEEKDGMGWANFAVKTRMDRAALAPILRNAVAAVDSNLPVLGIHTQNAQIAATVQNERIIADLTAGFGVLALVLAAIGIYGILAYSVSRRTSEIGIRMALGARPGMVLGMVLREAAWMALIGVTAGLGAALGMGRLIASMLYGLKPWDPATLAAAAAVLTAVALGASWIPARRAATIDPMQALRHE
jgi:predicted permease